MTLRRERCTICGGTEFVDAIDNLGKRYRGCARCVVKDLRDRAKTLRAWAATLRPQKSEMVDKRIARSDGHKMEGAKIS